MATSESSARKSRRRRPVRRPRHSGANGSSSMRIQILKSAAAAFRRVGYHGATVEEIAAALKMKKGNLYYYFKNKEEILFACHQYSLDRLMELLEEVEASGVSADEKLRRLIKAFVQTILDELHGTALFIDLEALSPPHLRTVIVRRDRFDRGIREVLERGIAEGTFARHDPKLLSFAILGAVNWIPRWFDPSGPATSEQIADHFADYLIAGLRRA